MNVAFAVVSTFEDMDTETPSGTSIVPAPLTVTGQYCATDTAMRSVAPPETVVSPSFIEPYAVVTAAPSCTYSAPNALDLLGGRTSVPAPVLNSAPFVAPSARLTDSTTSVRPAGRRW